MWGWEAWEEEGLIPLVAVSSSSPWQEKLLPCCWACPAWDHGWRWFPGKGRWAPSREIQKQEQVKGKNLPCHGYMKRNCSVHSTVVDHKHWRDALSITLSSPPPPNSPSLQRSNKCAWAQTASLPRAVESSLLPFITDLLAAGNEKPVWCLDFWKDSVLLSTEQKSATNITEGDAENWEYLNLAQDYCCRWLFVAWKGGMVEDMVEERLGF